MFKLNMQAIRQSANDSWLMANPANVANLANGTGESVAEISQKPPKLAGLAKLAISQQRECTSQPEPANDPTTSVPPGLEEPPAPASPAPELDPDRWCWPHSTAMNTAEIEAFTQRTILFNRRGLPALEAELLADKLVNRDRDGDDRRLCLECGNLSRAGGAMRCNQWQRAGMGAAGIPAALVLVLQRCDGFKPTR